MRKLVQMFDRLLKYDLGVGVEALFKYASDPGVGLRVIGNFESPNFRKVKSPILGGIRKSIQQTGSMPTTTKSTRSSLLG